MHGRKEKGRGEGPSLLVSQKVRVGFTHFLPAAKPSGPRTDRVVGVGGDEIGIPPRREIMMEGKE